MRPYKLAGEHRHTPEIEQVLSSCASQAVKVTFSPHLAPMSRGILSTVYAKASDGVDREACVRAAEDYYRGSPSVSLLSEGQLPDTAWVRGSNQAHINYAFDRRTQRIVAVCAIDNLVKGASGQAVQCMNVRFGFDEDAGIRSASLWP